MISPDSRLTVVILLELGENPSSCQASESESGDSASNCGRTGRSSSSSCSHTIAAEGTNAKRSGWPRRVERADCSMPFLARLRRLSRG